MQPGTPRFFSVSPSPQLYVELVVGARDTVGNPKRLRSVQNGTPDGAYHITGPNGVSPPVQVSFTDPIQRTVVRVVIPVVYGATYVGQFILVDTFGNSNAIPVSFVTPQPPTQPGVFVTSVHQGYPTFVTSGQNVTTTIVIDSNHVIATAANDQPLDTISVVDSTGSAITPTVEPMGSFRNTVRMTVAGTTGTAYTATFVLRDTAGNISTLVVPYVTPGVTGAFTLAVRQGYPSSMVSGQNALTTIVVDSSHVLAAMPNGSFYGTVSVSGNPAITVGYTDSGRTAMQLVVTGARGTSYTATITLTDVSGVPATIVVPYTTP